MLNTDKTFENTVKKKRHCIFRTGMCHKKKQYWEKLLQIMTEMVQFY